VQNLTQGPDGRTTALDSKRLWAHLMTAERVYQQLWRAELTRRLGVRFIQVADHEQLELEGWHDQGLRDGFSKRAAQVRAQCDAWGVDDTRTARQAARATRRPKDHAEPDAVIYDRWRAELAGHGVTAQRYAERLGRTHGRTMTEAETTALLAEFAGPDGVTAQASTFARRDVVDQLARRLPVGQSAAHMLSQLETLADRFLAERTVVIARDEQLAEVRYSTPELLSIEQGMLESATSRADAEVAVVTPETLRATLAAFPTIEADQAAAVTDLTRSGDGISLLVGKAGHGKTFVAGAPTPTRSSSTRPPTWSRSLVRSLRIARRGRLGAPRPARSTVISGRTAFSSPGGLSMCGAGGVEELDGRPTRGHGRLQPRQAGGQSHQAERGGGAARAGADRGSAAAAGLAGGPDRGRAAARANPRP